MEIFRSLIFHDEGVLFDVHLGHHPITYIPHLSASWSVATYSPLTPSLKNSTIEPWHEKFCSEISSNMLFQILSMSSGNLALKD